jgi:intein/homing endonuclease
MSKPIKKLPAPILEEALPPSGAEAPSREKMEKLCQLYLDDFLRFAGRVLKVQSIDGKILPLIFNRPQKVLHSIVESIHAQGRPVRLIALKARRMGFSTYFSARNYHKTSWNPNRYATQVTHEPEATDALFKMVKRFYNFTPEWIRPSTLYNNTKLLEFNTKDGKGLNSGFRVATAEKDDFGSGQLINFLHLCMHPNTRVLTGHGREKRIADLQVGDPVLTHLGNPGRVSAISRIPSDTLPGGTTAISIHPWLGNEVIMTPQHKVFTNLGWMEAGDLDSKLHLVSMPVRSITKNTTHLEVDNRHRDRIRVPHNGLGRVGPNTFPLNEETGFFVGYYLAEGCVSGNTPNGPSRIIFTLHRDEDAYAQRACDAVAAYCKCPPKTRNRPGTSTRNFNLDSVSLAGMVDRYFGRTDQKHIPDWVFDAGPDFCRGLVAGYLSGDGSKSLGGAHQGYTSNSICASSIRESLTYQVRDLVASLGYGWGGITYRDGGNFYGRDCKPQWTVFFNGECGYRLRELLGLPRGGPLTERSRRGQRYTLDLQKGFVWLRIKKITKTTCDDFYDIEVDHEDHSFRTAHFSVSNSEVSKYPTQNIQSLLTSILQCVPDGLENEIVFESTGKGIGGEFYDRFWAARYRAWVDRQDENGSPLVKHTVNEDADPDNNYTAVFLPWFIFELYELKPLPGFELTKEEKEIKIRYNLRDGQIYWRRVTIANKCNGSIETFQQEYPATPSEAFLGTGRPVFDVAKIQALMLAAPNPIARYECLTGVRQWMSKEDGRLQVWEEPKRGTHYIVSADVAEGLAHGDFSCADVIEHLTGKQVAHWHGKCLAPGTKILTPGGFKNIENIKIGDHVWTHMNRFRRVTQTYKRDYSGDLMEIRAQGNYETVRVTPDHPFLAADYAKVPYRKERYYRKNRQCWDTKVIKHLEISGLRWDTAADLKAVAIPRSRYSAAPHSFTIKRAINGERFRDDSVKRGYCKCGCGRQTPVRNRNNKRLGWVRGEPCDFILGHIRPVVTTREITVDADFATILGYYGSEGSIGYRREDGDPDRVCFSFGWHEEHTLGADCIDRLRRMGFNPTVKKPSSAYVVSLADKNFAELLLLLCGDGASRKQLHPGVLEWPDALLSAFLDAYLDGDGTVYQQDGSIIHSITTTSPAMARQLRDISLWLGNRPRVERILPGTMAAGVKSIMPRFNIKWVVSDRVKYKGMGDCEAEAYKVKKKTVHYSGPVYNLEVHEDNSYSTGCYVAHNCDADEFGVILMCLAKRYNEAWLVPERNNHGLTTVTVIVNEDYPKVYCEMIPEPPGRPRKRYGWLTNGATRPLIIDGLIKEIREGTHGIVCKDTFNEMMSFKIQSNGKLEADSGRFDDRVLSLSIGKHVRNFLELPSAGLPDHYKKQHRTGNRRVNHNRWT